MRPTVGLLVVGVIGCGMGEGGGSAVERVDQDRPLQATEVLRLGVLAEGGPESFDGVSALAFDRTGALYVGNGSSGTVRAFDSEGRFLHEFGGRGEGPSEFMTISSLYIVGDTVVVVDRGRGDKVAFFLRDGTFDGSFRIRREDGVSVVPIRPLQGGWLAVVRPPFAPVRLAVGDSLRREVEFRLVNPEEERLGPLIRRVPILVLYGSDDGGDSSLFRRQWSWGVDGVGRLFVAGPEGYQIDIYGHGGELVQSVSREVVPHAIDDEDVLAVRDRVMEIIDTLQRGPRPVPPEVREQQRRLIQEELDVRASLPRPRFASPLVRILVGDDGSFWVEHRDTASVAEIAAKQMFGSMEGPPDDSTEWGLFDSQWSYLGCVRLPARFRALAVRGTRVADVATDELDVEYVVVLEARGLGECATSATCERCDREMSSRQEEAPWRM